VYRVTRLAETCEIQFSKNLFIKDKKEILDFKYGINPIFI